MSTYTVAQFHLRPRPLANSSISETSHCSQVTATSYGKYLQLEAHLPWVKFDGVYTPYGVSSNDNGPHLTLQAYSIFL
eukprot:1158956-Pelagomonas_calceolata.AAC.13